MKTLDELRGSFAANGTITAANMELAALSYPVPGREDGRPVERFFLTSNQPATVRQRPYAWLEVDAETGWLLQYAHCSVQDFASALNTPLTETLDYSAPGGGSYRELLTKKRMFAQLYEEIREFAFTETPDEIQRGKLRQYRELQGQVIGPKVLEYYKVLSPEFFQWMDELGAELDDLKMP